MGVIVGEFPRGWSFTAQATAAPVGIVVPAQAGVAHVLDSFSAKVSNFNTATSLSTNISLSSSGGTYGSVLLALLGATLAAANTVNNDSAAESGLDLAAGPGESITVTFTSSQAGAIEFLLIQGHDI